MLGHSSITITPDAYTSLLPEADLAMAETAARLVARALAASEDTASDAESKADGTEKSGAEAVSDDADPLGDFREIYPPSAHAPLTQTAPDAESEAEQGASLREKLQVSDLTHGAPGRIRTCDTRFRSFP
ncbi:hypothetical protein [Streptomyces endocoffeicus]|uniref:hypothetical protein n=1 Tax=Streptomyces endocoffeicus TaxID=2898945 RepID=UPI001E2E9973|nr:hypothetical protein [Streptomyces endocoffeicus]